MTKIIVGKIMCYKDRPVCIYKEPINDIAIIADTVDNKVNICGVPIKELTDYICPDTGRPCDSVVNKSVAGVDLTCGLCRAQRILIAEDIPNEDETKA